MKTFSEKYLAYINSDAWRRRRALKLFLAGGLTGKVQCELCRVMFLVNRVDVHHATYERFGEEPMSDLRILCRNCHECVEEIEFAEGGGGLDDISEQLLETLAAIDKRLGPQPEAFVVPPFPIAAPKYAETTIGDLAAIIANKRLAAGIKEVQPTEAP